jgi:hypothetical protein
MEAAGEVHRTSVRVGRDGIAQSRQRKFSEPDLAAVRDAVVSNPLASSMLIAKVLGVHESTVRRIRDELGDVETKRVDARGHLVPARKRHGRTVAERFDAFVQRTTEGCWGWSGGTDGHGYGHLYWNGRQHKAHRISWTLAHGPIPPGLCVLHRCDNPACTRPDHLFLGTNRDNSVDMSRKNRWRNQFGSGRGLPVELEDNRGGAASGTAGSRPTFANNRRVASPAV